MSSQEVGSDVWHLRKEISVGEIVTAVSLIVAIAVGWTTMGQRMAWMEGEQKENKEFIKGASTRNEDMMIRMTKVEIELMNLQKLVALQSQVLNSIDRKLPNDSEISR